MAELEKPKCSVVIVGAGSSRRMDGVDKIFAELLRKPILAWTVEPFEKSNKISEIVIVLSGSSIGEGKRLMVQQGWQKVSDIVEGGRRRQDSVFNGLTSLDNPQIVMIHDAARPCVNNVMIERGLAAVRETGAACAGVQVVDTIRRFDRMLRKSQTLPRNELWSVQTPQVFDYQLIMRAHHEVKRDVTDDAAMVEAIGGSVVPFEGSYDNMKITTRTDLVYVRELLQRTI